MFHRISKVFPVLLFSLAFLAPALVHGLPSILNYIPSVDLIADHNLLIQGSYYKFQFTDDATKAAIKKDASLIYSLGFGLKKAEFGVDLFPDKSFVNKDSGLYAGPAAWNFKYKFLTEGVQNDSFSLVAGAFNLGVNKYGGVDYYFPSPYIMGAKQFKDVRFHLGYQWNLQGYRRQNGERNDGIMAGLDTVIIKSKKSPVSLMVDYFGGPAKTLGVGFWHVISPSWAWGISTYHPIHSKLGATQLPKQYWVGVSYFVKL